MDWFYYGLHPQIITKIGIINAIIAFTDHLKNNNISKDSKILIQFKIKFVPYGCELKNKINLYFRDSLLLLPDYLKDLAIKFKLENKGKYPHKFINNQNIPLNYIGQIPSFIQFNHFSFEEYLNYYNSFKYKDKWKLREETIKYCN